MRILLVNPLNQPKEQSVLPLGLLSLATILQNNGHNVEIIDLTYLRQNEQIITDLSIKESYKQIGNYLLSKKPDLIGFGSMCNSYHVNIILSRYIKQIKPEIQIIFGGAQASLTAVHTLKAFPWIDLVVIGEAESRIESIIKALQGEGVYRDIPGIVYREEVLIRVTGEMELIADLDSLPILDYQLLPFMNECEVIYLEAGRGCPYGCAYCSTKTFWKRRFRLKSTDRLLMEIKILYDKYQKRKFSIIHDLFTASKTRFLDFCEGLITQNIRIDWSCSARTDTLDEEMIVKMRLAGCSRVYLGIETGSARMQEIIKKKLNLQDAWAKILLLKKHGVEVTLSFIYGFPEETLDDLYQTLNFIKLAIEHKIDRVQLHLCTVLAGTELFTNFHSQLVFDGVQSDFGDVINLESFVDIIKENVDVFPHLYNLQTNLRSRFLGLDQFISEIFPVLYREMPVTYHLLMSCFNNNLAQLFLDFSLHTVFLRNKTTNEIKETTQGLEKTQEWLKLLVQYICKNDYGKNTILIQEMAKYEFELFKFINITTSVYFGESTYKYDVYQVWQDKGGLQEICLTPVRIHFERLITGDIRVKKVDQLDAIIGCGGC